MGKKEAYMLPTASSGSCLVEIVKEEWYGIDFQQACGSHWSLDSSGYKCLK